MIFYHYTVRWAIDGIRSVGFLKPSPSQLGHLPWVSLTTDTDPSGHGLPDGREILDLNAPLKFRTVGQRRMSYDHTEARVVINLDPSDLNLVNAASQHDPEMLFALDVMAYLPTEINPSDPVLLGTRDMILKGLLPRKSPTWWYYKIAIPMDQILRFEERLGRGGYVPIA